MPIRPGTRDDGLQDGVPYPDCCAIDDDPQVLRALERDLRELRAELVLERDPERARAPDDAEFDVVIAACRMPDIDGLPGADRGCVGAARRPCG